MAKLSERVGAFRSFGERGPCVVCSKTINMLWFKRCCFECDKNGSYKRFREEEERTLIREKKERQDKHERKALRKSQRRRR